MVQYMEHETVLCFFFYYVLLYCIALCCLFVALFADSIITYSWYHDKTVYGTIPLRVAHASGCHLNANHFKRWFLLPSIPNSELHTPLALEGNFLRKQTGSLASTSQQVQINLPD